MKTRTKIRFVAVILLVATHLATPPDAESRDWPRCDTGGSGSTSCTGEFPGGSCSITCSVGSACCSLYDGCYCAYDM